MSTLVSKILFLPLLSLCLLATPASAAITLEIQQVGTAISDGVNPTVGSFDVFLTSDDPTNDFVGANAILSGFQANLAKTGTSTGSITPATVVLGPVGEPANFTDAFPGTPVNPFVVSGDIGAISSFTATPYDLTTGTPIGLFSVGFTALPGQTGSFDVGFITSGATPTLLTNSSFTNIPFAGVTGTISVGAAAVPEPASCLFLGSLAVAGGCSLRRRQKAKTASA